MLDIDTDHIRIQIKIPRKGESALAANRLIGEVVQSWLAWCLIAARPL